MPRPLPPHTLPPHTLPPKPPRAPAIVYVGLTVALLVLLASIAFNAHQPPPPAIAEITPQAQHQITKSPNQLSSSLGSAAGAPGAQGSGATTTSTTTLRTASSRLPSTAPGLVGQAAVHHCFGNPPRQIPDTQSPPCVAYWAGNNGGATTRGVTGSTIRVATTIGATTDPANGGLAYRAQNDLQLFFNRFFELYGRTIDLLNTTGTGSGTTPCATAAAQADSLAQQSIFASNDQNGESDACFETELARDRVITLVGGGDSGWFSEHTMSRYAPYLWQYPMAYNNQFTGVAHFACAQLANKPASYAPEASLAARRRTFGLILEYYQTAYPYNSAYIQTTLAQCGVKLAYQFDMEEPDGGSAPQDADMAQPTCSAIAHMAADNVTTILVDSDVNMESYIPACADSIDYYPEWLVDLNNSYNWQIDQMWPSADQRRALLGMAPFPEQVPYPSSPVNWALSQVDPGFQINSNSQLFYYIQEEYKILLLLSSGIQMAGPYLTPATFQTALESTRFPNPFSWEMEGAVGFPSGSHAMTSDLSVMWWSNTAASPYPDEGAGTWCYVDDGERFQPDGNWSVPMNLFAQPCTPSPPGSG